MHNTIGEINPAIKNIAIPAPIRSVIFIFMLSLSCVFFFITYRLRRITAAQFLYAFYFFFKAHRGNSPHRYRTKRQGGESR